MSSRSSQAGSRRIVPAIPHQLARRANVADKDGKSDRTQTNGTGAGAGSGTGGAVSAIAAKQERQNGQDVKASAAVEEPADKPDNEAEKPQRQTNGTHSTHTQDAMARPFVPQRQKRQSASLVFGGLPDSSSASPVPVAILAPPPPLPPASHPPPPPHPPPASSHPPLPSAGPPVQPQYPPRDHDYTPAPQFAPAPAPWVPPQVNGHGFLPAGGAGAMSPSPSHSSSVPLGGSGIVTPDALAPKHHVTVPSFHVPALDANAKHLLDFLLGQFGKSEFADYVLELGSAPKHLMLPVHSLLLARCPSLLAILHQLPRRRDNHGPLFVQLPQSYYFQDPDAFADALRFVYGAPLVDPARVLHGISHPAAATGDLRAALDARMKYALSYLATGHCLDIAEIAIHGANMASRLLAWETLETLLAFGVDGQQFDDGPPTYGYYAGQLMHQAISFIVMHITPDFVFDPSASQLPCLPRVPHRHTSERPSRPDSRESLFATPDPPPTQRLNGIRFGQAPPPDANASFPVQLLSSVLLSLPFHLLKPVLENYLLTERVGWEAQELLAQDVVRERERRREDAFNALQNKADAETILKWQESPSDGHNRGARIVRHRIY